MANMDSIVLTGDIRHQANQLFNILRERELSPEQLEKILPITKDFLSQFNAVLREQIEADKECHINTIKTLLFTLERLTDQLKSQVTSEQKEQILKAILEIQKSIKEIEINRKNKAITYYLTSAHIKLHKHTQYAYSFPTIW